ncbi:MAG: hypothetical protein EA365_08775 [Gloeocapsa sp. DLM2.Bin57]|nr:MAG: hypothetical protein EA365_08775 [Gloeocapsa sp. DLM2.Bin57]
MLFRKKTLLFTTILALSATVAVGLYLFSRKSPTVAEQQLKPILIKYGDENGIDGVSKKRVINLILDLENIAEEFESNPNESRNVIVDFWCNRADRFVRAYNQSRTSPLYYIDLSYHIDPIHTNAMISFRAEKYLSILRASLEQEGLSNYEINQEMEDMDIAFIYLAKYLYDAVEQYSYEEVCPDEYREMQTILQSGMNEE